MQSPNSIEPGQEVDFQGQKDKRSHGSSNSRDRNQKKKYQREGSRSNSESQRHRRQKQTRSPQSSQKSMPRSDDQSLGEDNGLTIYFSNLDPNFKEDDLKKYFKKYGSIDQLDIIRYPYTNESRGYGFVQFENKSEGQKCITELNGKDINGYKIKLEKAKRRLARQKTPGQYLGYNPPKQNRYYRRSPNQDRYSSSNRYRSSRRYSRSRSHSHGRRRNSRSRSMERKRYHHHQDRSRYQRFDSRERERERDRGDRRDRDRDRERDRRDSFRQRERSGERKQDRSNERDRTRQQQFRSKDRSHSPKQYSRN